MSTVGHTMRLGGAKDEPTIVDPSGKPARQAIDASCPQCGAGPDKRGPSCGFGVRRPCCLACGFVWQDEVYKEPA